MCFMPVPLLPLLHERLRGGMRTITLLLTVKPKRTQDMEAEVEAEVTMNDITREGTRQLTVPTIG